MNIHWQGSKCPKVFVGLKNSYTCRLSCSLYGGVVSLVWWGFCINMSFEFMPFSSCTRVSVEHGISWLGPVMENMCVDILLPAAN